MIVMHKVGIIVVGGQIIKGEAAAEWEKAALREFTLWAKTKMCDATRQHTFWDIQELAFRSELVSGDTLAVLRNLKVESAWQK